MSEYLRDVFEGRPWWMNGLMVFCAFMTFIYLPWDIFWKPVSEDVEVWFGISFAGWAAKLMALPHWFVYAAGAYGFRRRRPWMATWGAVYVGQIAFGMWLWSVSSIGGLTGSVVGIFPALPFGFLAWLLWSSREHFEAARPNLRERYGDWGLVTGASAGIGAEFARSLARQGVSCVLTARRGDRLRSLADELEKDYEVSTRVIAADLSNEEGARSLCDQVSDLEIGILVNNAGLGYVGRFDKQDTERVVDLVRVNCLAPVLLTSLLLPGMKQRGRGAVILTGSVAGRQPLPLHAVYSATKAFDQLFGESLYVELRDSGIDVLVLEPGSTETEFQEAAGELPHAGEPASRVVEVALDALGGQPSVVSGWFNWARANLASRLASRTLVPYVAREAMRGNTPHEML
jgi:hypothetical protein